MVKKLKYDKRKVAQELECNFLGSGDNVFDSNLVQKILENDVKDPVNKMVSGGLWLWKEPILGHRYIMGVDVSRGDSEDFSTFQIFDFDDKEQAVEYLGKLPPDNLADIVYKWATMYKAFVVIDITEVPYKLVGKYRDNKIAPMLYPTVIHKVARDFNDAYVLIETNSSEQVAHILHNELEYGNLVFVNRSTKTGQIVSGGFGGGKTQLGVNTDKRVKRIGCFTFKSLLEEKKLLVFDADVISEISTFIQVRDSYQADEGYHDDLVMPLVLFSWLTTNPYFREMSDVNIREAMYQERIKQIEEEVVPFGFIMSGNEEELIVEDGDVWKEEKEKPHLPPGYSVSTF